MKKPRPNKLLIDRADQLDAFVSPVRNQIHLHMETLGECTIGELAESMRREPESLYYHIRRLERRSIGIGKMTSANRVPSLHQRTSSSLGDSAPSRVHSPHNTLSVTTVGVSIGAQRCVGELGLRFYASLLHRFCFWRSQTCQCVNSAAS